jgi:hypothetical protein
VSFAKYNVNGTNRMNQTWQNVNQASGYDAAGDVTNDGRNNYLCDGVPVDWSSSTGRDGEGRLCAVQTGGSGGPVTGYLYNVEGTRVARGSMSSFAACPNSASSFTAVQSQYLLDPGGDQVTELSGSGSNVSWRTPTSGLRAPWMRRTTPMGCTSISRTGWERAACRPLPWAARKSASNRCPSATD